MRFLRHEPSQPDITDFWAWWPENRDRVALVITSSAFFFAEDTDRTKPAIDAWAAALPDSLTEGVPAPRIKVDLGTDMDWSFRKALGVR